MSNLHTDALSIPCDPELLEPLGRVAWAAIRLHSGVRDAINHLDGAPSDTPFTDPLGTIKNLRKRADAAAAEPDRTALITWRDRSGTPATRQRNGVLHAIA